jgi:cysteine desulfurase
MRSTRSQVQTAALFQVQEMTVNPRRTWFNHVFAAPVLAEAAEAVEELLERERREAAPPGEERRRQVIEEARGAVAGLLGAQPDEIILTSGGTEAANLAIKGRARAAVPGRLVTSSVEHTAVLYPMRSLEREGFEVHRLPVDSCGRVDPAHLEHELQRPTGLVSIQHANHELGTMQPLAQVALAARKHGVTLHVDAVAGAGLAALDVGVLGVDLLSLSAARLGGLPGVGALWVRPGVRLLPQIEGGIQEGGRRGGSENLAGLAALAVAAAAVAGREQERWAHTRRLRHRLESGLRSAIPDMVVNGPPADERLPGHLHVSFPGAEGESMVYRLRRRGVEVSTGSACTGEAGKPSHVLQATGMAPERSRCSVLFSLGAASGPEDVQRALEVVPDAVEDLRRMGAGVAAADLAPPSGLPWSPGRKV